MPKSIYTVETFSIPHLRTLVRGTVLTAGDEGYDEARSVFYNGMSRLPAAIARPADPTDVARIVCYAREEGIGLAVRSGGHSPAGHGGIDDGIVIDLSSLGEIDIDVDGHSAWAQTGLTAGAFTAATGRHGLVTGFGDSGSVGIGGITLGGGVGFLHRKLGLTIDNVLAAEIVTADGEIRWVDALSHPDLFWAIRGGGGNFGVVTRIRYRLYEIGDATAGMLVLPASPRAIARTLEILSEGPEELSGLANVLIAPPMPFLPPEHHGKAIIFAVLVHIGEPEAAERALAPLRGISTPIVDSFQRVPYAQIYEDAPEPPRPPRMALQSFFTDGVDTATGEAILDALPRSRAPMRVVQFRPLGGAVARVAPDETAFPHRNRPVMAMTGAAYADPAESAEHQAWATEFADTLRQGERGAYVGFLGAEGESRVREAYAGPTWDRLRAIKRKYDPTNLFRQNQNVKP